MKKIILFFFLPSLSLAGDSAHVEKKTQSTAYFFLNDFHAGNDSILFFPDSTLDDFQNYERIPVHKYKTLGNSGTAVQSYYFIPRPFKPVYDGDDHYYPYRLTAENNRFYETRVPYTDLFYSLGSKREENLNIVHAQNIRKSFGFGLLYNRQASQGFYDNRVTELVNAAAYNYFRTRDHRYGLAAFFSLSNYTVEENGGLAEDELFRSEGGTQSQTLLTNLQEAVTRNKKSDLTVAQHVNFGRKIFTGDTIKGKPQSVVRPMLRVNHSFHYSRAQHSYSDELPNPGFYAILFPVYDTVPVFDTSTVYHLDNRLDLIFRSNIRKEPIIQEFSAGASQKNIHDRQNDTLDTVLTSVVFHARLKAGPIKRFRGLFDMQYVVSGAGEGRYYASGSFVYSGLPFKSEISLFGAMTEYDPPLPVLLFLNNNISWRNQFLKITCRAATLNLASDDAKMKVAASLRSWSNFVYYSSYTAMPAQLAGDVTLMDFSISKDIRTGRWGFPVSVRWQEISGADVLRFPQWIIQQSTFYENRIFNGALLLQAGIDFLWFSQYYSDTWMPFTSAFYLQNDTKTGSYPFIDLFLNLKIKSARIFLKAGHVNAGFTGNTYHLAPLYPAPGRIIKLGINWRMMG